MKITPQQIEQLRSTASIAQWKAVRDAIKNANGGNYPDDWWVKLMTSGLASKVTQEFGWLNLQD
jgi:hypothetical protein